MQWKLRIAPLDPSESTAPFLKAGSKRAVRPRASIESASEESPPKSVSRPRAEIDVGVEGEDEKVHDGLRPIEERMEKAREYYADKDPETTESGGRSVNESRPSEREGAEHG